MDLEARHGQSHAASTTALITLMAREEEVLVEAVTEHGEDKENDGRQVNREGRSEGQKEEEEDR